MGKRSIGDWLVNVLIYCVLVSMSAITLLPFLNLTAKSFSENWAVLSGKVGIWPVGFQLGTMKLVMTNAAFIHSFLVSAGVTVVGTCLSVFLTAVTAYPLSKRSLPGVRIVMILFIFTMMFNGGIIPNYLLIKYLGLINNLWSLILPSLIAVFNMLVVKSYYETLPEALEESAKMDGAKTFTILFRIILPLSGPVIATVALFYAVSYWNDFFQAMLYISKPALKTLQLYMRDLVLSADTSVLNLNPDDRMNIPSEGIQAATIIASTLPILAVYPMLQRYFIKGVLIGSVKG